MGTGQAGATELIEACASTQASVADRVYRALIRFPLGAQVWQAVDATAIARGDDRFRTPGAVIGELLTDLARLRRSAVPRLACSPIEDYGVRKSAFARALTGNDDDRLWASIAVGRLGDVQPIDGLLFELAAGRRIPPLLSSPGTARHELSQARPIPDALRGYLRGWEGSDEQHVTDVLSALIGGRDSAGKIFTAEGEVGGVTLIADAPSADPAETVRQFLSEDALQTPAWTDTADPSWLRALQHVDRETAGHLIANLVGRFIEAGPDDEVAGHRLMVVLGMLPPRYPLSRDTLARALAASRSALTVLAQAQLTFLVARADLDDVLAVFAFLLTQSRHNPDAQSAAVDLLERVAGMSTETYGPVRNPELGYQPDDDVARVTFDVNRIPFDPRLSVGTRRGGDFVITRGVTDLAGHPPPERDRRPRAVRADVQLLADDGIGHPIAEAFVRGARHRLSVWIGHEQDSGPMTLVNLVPFVDADVVPDLGDTTDLQVTVGYGERTQRKTLKLPNDRDRSSAPCEFDLFVAPDQPEVRVTIIVGQGDRTLQQFQLHGVTVGSLDEHSDGNRILLEAEVLARPHEDVTASPVDVSISRSGAGAPDILMHDGHAEIVTPWDEGIRDTVDIVAAELYDVGSAAAAGDAEAAWADLLRMLVAQGTQLHGWLNSHGYAALDSARSVQLTEADPTKPLPIEIVYDGPLVKDDAVACPQWAEALEQGHCENCAQITDFRSPYICPLGFWGLTKVIERQTGVTPADPGRLQPLNSVLFAASDLVLEADYETTKETLTKAFVQPPLIAEEWEQWPKLVGKDGPTMFVVLPHQDRDPKVKVDYLEIGATDRLKLGELGAGFLRTLDGPHPLVLLLGCRTANASVSYHNFIADFRTNGAPIVLGTLATILGRDAAAIAQEFIRELAAARTTGAGKPIPFGEAMRAVRRAMVAKRNAAAPGLIAFGDSDWTMDVGA